MRAPRYQTIADDLRARVERGEFADDRLLPSEAALGADYQASRVTIRHGLEILRDEGLLGSRQGFGWFVAADPLRQSLARLGTIEGQLEAAGRTSERQVLDFGFGPAPSTVRAILGADEVLCVRRLNLADGVPFARVTVWCPESLARELSRADVERSPFYELLGIELGGAEQTIAAALADADDAGLLGVVEGSAVLVCRRTTLAADGSPVLASEFVFPAHLTEFVVELPRPQASMAPSGLRLVE